MLIRALVILAVAVLAGGPGATAARAANVWPHGAKAALALTYDDALQSQLDHAIPALDAAGFKATFFLSGVRQADVGRWRAAAREGHELANHTIFHPCARASLPQADPRYTSEAYTPASLLKEIAQQNVLLSALDGHDRHGFATPCGQTQAGGMDYLEPLRASHLVTYARGVVETDADLAADVASLDPMHIPAFGIKAGSSGDELIALAKRAVAGGGMAVFLFHGVGGDYLTVSDQAHRQLIDWLASHRDEVWVAPLQRILDWAATHRTPAAHTR